MNRILILMIFIVVIVAGWSATWIYAAQRISSEAQSYFAATANTTQQISCGQFDVGGFPFRFDITCTNFLAVESDLSLSLPEIKVTILTYRPTHGLVFAQGPAIINDNFSGSKRQLSWSSLQASIRTNGWALERISIQGENIALIDTIIGEKLIASAKQINMHLIENEQAYDSQKSFLTLDAFITLEEIDVPEFAVANASIAAQAAFDAMPDDLRLWSLANLSRNWFENQTGIELLKFDGSDETSSFSIIGNLTTTAQSMPNGDFDFNSTNLAQRFQSVLDDTGVEVVFGQQSENGDRYQSYTIRHGVILAGNIPLLTLAPIR